MNWLQMLAKETAVARTTPRVRGSMMPSAAAHEVKAVGTATQVRRNDDHVLEVNAALVGARLRTARSNRLKSR